MNYTSRQPGSKSGLFLALHVHQDDYLYASSPSAGFRILLHGPGEQPMMIERGLKVAPGSSTQIAVAASYITELPSPYGDCEASEGYVQSKCLTDCVTNYVIKNCSCKDVYMLGDVPVCDPRKFYECVLPTEANYVRDSEAEKCNCHRQCHHLSYHATISESLLADSVAEYFRRAHGLPGTLDDVIKDHCVLEIFFTEMKYTFVETQAAYTTQSLMCDIGGSLGLVLGATMLTVCEIADFLFQLSVHWIKARASAVVVEP